jgi:pimeloyl-ACP methyl ester carboxylesterase
VKPVVYLLPGLLCDAAVWADQIHGLGRDFEVRVADFTAFDSIGAMAQSVLDVAPPRFSLVGHSMGGRVALELHRRAPDRVERLALLDTGTHGVKEGEAAKRQVLIDLADREGMDALCEAWLPPMVHPDRLNDPTLMPALRAMVRRMSPAIFRNEIHALLTRPVADAVLAHIRCPVLVGVGAQDQWSPPAQHQEIVAAIPHAQYVVFDNSGHMTPVERPRAVSDALKLWLQQPVVEFEGGAQ